MAKKGRMSSAGGGGGTTRVQGYSNEPNVVAATTIKELNRTEMGQYGELTVIKFAEPTGNQYLIQGDKSKNPKTLLPEADFAKYIRQHHKEFNGTRENLIRREQEKTFKPTVTGAKKGGAGGLARRISKGETIVIEDGRSQGTGVIRQIQKGKYLIERNNQPEVTNFRGVQAYIRNNPTFFQTETAR